MNRRDFIALGTTGLVGARLVDVLAASDTWKESKEGKAKNVIVRKLERGANRHMRTFVKTPTGFRVTGDEGFVAVDKSGKTVKLVDRLEFSHQNFTAIKNWDS